RAPPAQPDTAAPPDQLHQHNPAPSLRSPIDRSEATHPQITTQERRSVAHQPELLSPTYRNRVRNLSPSNRTRSVQHQQGSHRLPSGLLVTESGHGRPHQMSKGP